MDMQWIYGQMQGEVGDMSIGVYADWAHAKGKGATAANGNLLGAQDAGTAGGLTGQVLINGQKYDAYSIRATLEPVARLTVGAGYGYRKTTLSATTANKHSVFKLGAGYSIYQNMIVSLSYMSDRVTTAANVSNTVKTTVLDYVIYM